MLEQLPNSCKTVLDIGCGTGEFSRLLATQVEEVLAIDLSPKTIEIAKQHSVDFLNIDFQVADVLHWVLPSEKFNAIVSIATLHYLPVQKLLPNWKAALKSGGRLIILDLCKHEALQDLLSDSIAVPLNYLLDSFTSTTSLYQLVEWRKS